MRIGELARQAGVGDQTIRYYERVGLLPPPLRSLSGYRDYGAQDLQRVLTIRRLQAIGFTLREISEILRCEVQLARQPALEGQARARTVLLSSAQARLEFIKQQISALARKQAQMEQLIARLSTARPTDVMGELRAHLA